MIDERGVAAATMDDGVSVSYDAYLRWRRSPAVDALVNRFLVALVDAVLVVVAAAVAFPSLLSVPSSDAEPVSELDDRETSAAELSTICACNIELNVPAWTKTSSMGAISESCCIAFERKVQRQPVSGHDRTRRGND